MSHICGRPPEGGLLAEWMGRSFSQCALMLTEWDKSHQPAYRETDVGPIHHYRWRDLVANNNYIGETYSSMGLVMALYLESIVSLCFLHVGVVSICIVYVSLG